MSTVIGRLRAGAPTPELMQAAAAEGIESAALREKILAGRAVVPLNNRRLGAKAVAVGEGLRTKVNANIGTSEDYPDTDDELDKLRVAVAAGADTVMDLSTGGDLEAIRRAVRQATDVPLGTVPVYEASLLAQETSGNLIDLTADALFEAIERHAEDGVDFMTVHAGVTRQALDVLAKQKRVADIVSRGGAVMAAWMLHHDRENPLYEQFDRLIDIAYRYDITLSLGDGLRPGCLADATDGAQIQELVTLGELVEACRQADVQVIVEGPGHVPFDQISANVRLEKEICRGAPFYVLGPLVTDIAPGYDHITAAIGGTVAASAGADFLCYVTPREHLGLPTAEDVHLGVISCRLAGHAADIVKGVPGALEWDLALARARKALDWETQIALALDPVAARRVYGERQAGGRRDGCTMCSGLCAMKLVSDYLDSPTASCEFA